MRKIILTIYLGLAALVAAAQTNIQVRAPKVVTLDEEFRLHFIIEGAHPTHFHWEEGNDFENLWGPEQGRSTSVQIINGNRTESSQTTYSYRLKPNKVGKFLLPAATAVVNGKEIHSPEKEIEVLAVDSHSSYVDSSHSESDRVSNDNAVPDIILKLEVNKNNVVTGEPVKASIKLYTRVAVAGFESALFPPFDGFWTQVTVEPTYFSFERELLDGTLYESTLLREYVLIPQHAGKIEIPSAELVVLQNVPVMLYGIMPDNEIRRHKVKSPAVTINVRDLPSPAPDSFRGGVGSFNVTAELSRNELKMHDAAYLQLKVTGNGNIQLLEVPQIDFPQEMESYDPTITSDVASNGLSGTKVYEYPFIPRRSGEYEIGPVRYSYYDVEHKKYETITLPAMQVYVAEGEETDAIAASSGSHDGVLKSKVTNKSSDIRYITRHNPDLKAKGGFFLGSTLFWCLSVLIIAVAAIVFFVIRKRSVRNADLVGVRHRKATRMALRRLRKAGNLLKKEQFAEFYAELHNALLGYASDKLNIPVSDLSKDRISEVFLEKGVSQSTVEQLMGILDSCEYARYAPASAGQTMVSDYEQAIEVISSLDEGLKSRKSGMGRFLSIVLLLSVSTATYASDEADAKDLWDSANEAYGTEDYAGAIEGYEAIMDMGLESPELYYNAGNACYKDGNIAKAVLFYERALKLDPSYSDAIYNLNLVNGSLKDKIDPVPEFFLKEWLRKVSYITDSDGWAVWFIVLLAVTMALVLLFLLAESVIWKRIGFYSGIITMILMFSALAFSIWQKKEYEESDKAIVMKELDVRSTPSTDASGTILFDLNPGTKVNILDIMGASTKISISDGRQGWVDTSSIEII